MIEIIVRGPQGCGKSKISKEIFDTILKLHPKLSADNSPLILGENALALRNRKILKKNGVALVIYETNVGAI